MKRVRKTHKRLPRVGASLLLVGIIVFQALTIALPHRTTASTVPHGGLKRVIVQYRGSFVTAQSNEGVDAQVKELSRRVGWLSGDLAQSAGYKKITRSLSQMPVVFMDVDPAGEASLKTNPNVVSVTEDTFFKLDAVDFQVAPGTVGGDYQTGFSDGSSHFTGANQAVANIDTGVDTANAAFAGAVISEACYSIAGDYTDATVTSSCPSGTESTATGSAQPCTDINSENCTHGTGTAALSVMRSTTLTNGSDTINTSGVAKAAKLIAIKNTAQLTEKTGQADFCGDSGNQTQTCTILSGSGILSGLNRVLELSNDSTFTTPIAAVNISQGSSNFFSDAGQCQSSTSDGSNTALNTAMLALKRNNVATVISAGNSGDQSANADKISTPACLSNAVSVSASTHDHNMTSYTNAGPLTSIVAPGGEIDLYNGTTITDHTPHADGGLLVPTLNDQWITGEGTSYSAPIVSGAYALMREKDPTASVDTILQVFKDTGTSVTESRSGYTGTTHKEVNIPSALAAADDLPTVTSVTGPSGSVAAGSTAQLAIVATNADQCTTSVNGTNVGDPVTLTGGQGTQSVTVPTSGTSVTYLVSCVDSSNPNYSAQKSITLAVSGGSDDGGPSDTGGTTDPSDSNSTWVPGVPHSGLARNRSAYIVIICCLFGLLLINSRPFATRRR